ncbi:hypothetical protein RRG08_047575 [Elysia crispata]|uniref:Uncharacterized protein n=1 Tax=Elysia crispata TaxID=231223 RepID=A0AAE0YPZ4_9GAST|nr:hypothetical protein RRG08_047575 [Elysia crispata]
MEHSGCTEPQWNTVNAQWMHRATVEHSGTQWMHRATVEHSGCTEPQWNTVEHSACSEPQWTGGTQTPLKPATLEFNRSVKDYSQMHALRYAAEKRCC